jgi:DNA mismatch repair protein MutS2
MKESSLYPASLEEKIGFNRIKTLIKEHCEGELGTTFVDKIQFTSNFERINQLVSQTDEFQKILTSGNSFPGGEYFNIRKYLVKASKIDAFLLEEEFHELKLSLLKAELILKFFKKHAADYTNLSLLTVGIYLNPQINYEINRVIDERGKIRNTASDLLLDIRNQLQKLEFRVRARLENILKQYMTNGYSNDDATITIRNGRLVLPVRAEFKRVVGGFIHDESSTGQTAFIEPSQVVEINNDIRDLIYKEKREITRILIALTDLVRPEISNLDKCNELLGTIDFIRAKARLAVDLDAILPEIFPKTLIDWKEARHPLLYLSHIKSGKEVVPLNIHLTQGTHILVISGPNAGGKSVCLQTVGLLQYMIQCGLLVPVAEGSKMGIFTQLFIDIGDEQSLENDLSTYSSHLINMKYFLKYATAKTLVLIDEFGTGTEPQFGGAIAEAILEDMRRQKVTGVITTHYSNLKKYAENKEGVVNGAMRFDINRMEPLFMLDIGKPGSSFALEIAGKIGLDQKIIEQAKKNIGTTHVKFERLIAELEEEKREFEKQKRTLEEKEKELKELVDEYESMKKYLDARKDQLIREAKNQAEDLIRQANKEIEKTIRIIQEKKAEKEITRKVRKDLKEFQNRLESKDQKKPEPKPNKVAPKAVQGPIKENDYVRIRNSNTYGITLDIKGNSARLAIGDLKTTVDLSRLIKISAEEYKRQTDSGLRAGIQTRGLNLAEKQKSFSSTLDVRGKRADEALIILANYLDDAVLLGMKELRILHGKGDGILRDVIRNYLREVPFIENFQDEHADRGGAGITLVTLK